MNTIETIKSDLFRVSGGGGEKKQYKTYPL